MINYDTFCSKLEPELIRLGFVKGDYVFTTSFSLGDFSLITIEHRFEKKDIWYRNTLRGYLNRVMFDENLETTQKEWDKVTESITKLLAEYKNYRVKTKIDEIGKDFE